jgi:pyruvate/2-oxoacid:ferredoxin oxidoreductase alpha subunit
MSTQMKIWRLDRPKGESFRYWKKSLFKGEYLEIPRYPIHVWWRYYTLLHLTKAVTRLTRDEHIIHMDRIESGRYYSKASMNAMEARHLARIAALKQEAEAPQNTRYEDAARVVISRMEKDTKNDKSNQPKIRNGRRCYT